MILDKDNLRTRLMSDIKVLGLPTDFILDIRGYSKTYHGRYDIKSSTVIIYPIRYKESKLAYNYSKLLRETIHEVIHHYQWKHTEYKRIKGIMHNPEFYELENWYIRKAIILGLINPKEVGDLEGDINVYATKEVVNKNVEFYQWHYF